MTMQTVGRPTRPEDVQPLDAGFASLTGGRGLLQDEIITIETTDGPVTEDGCIRPGTNAEALADPARIDAALRDHARTLGL